MSLDLNKSYATDGDDEMFSGNGNVGVFPSDSDVDADTEFDGSSDEDVSYDNTTNEGTSEAQCDAHRDVERNDVGDNVNSVESLKRNVEKLLEVGSSIDTLDEVYVLYCEYARLVGFSVKKGTQLYFMNTMDVRVKLYLCSCEGLPDERRAARRLNSYKKQTFRTNCKARLRVVRDDMESPWKVSFFRKNHNHELVDPSESYLLRSARNMSQSKKTLLVAMKSSGIGVSRAYSFLETEAGSRENVGFIRKDAYNELHREKKLLSKFDNGDANKLMEYFTQKGLSDPSFYWKANHTDDARLKDVFFRDTRCLNDYKYFGDVVSVDATYKTNKYDLICVPIIGINHHRTNVMFAIGFLSNEQTESYEWLFRTFLESMYQKEPSIIFSDQDHALMNAVDYTFRDASHRLCQWHVNKNAVKHFGKLNSSKHFKSMWYRCMNGCENEEQFELTWSRMVDEHNLSGNKWFCSMYKLRKRWSSAFTRDKFSAGLRATSRSEVTNKVLKDLCSSTSTVYDFVVGFERLQKAWRRGEFEEDALCRGMPGMFVQRTEILIQLGELCTRNVFKSFQYEALNSIAVNLTYEPPDMNDEVLEFRVTSRTSITGYRYIKLNQHTQVATCSCHMWETEGVLCRHIFRVYFHLNFTRIPEELIMNRWRRDCKQRLSAKDDSLECVGSDKFSNMVFVNHNMKLVHDMLSDCKDDGICRDAINEYIRAMVQAVNGLRKQATCSPNSRECEKRSAEVLHRPVKNPHEKKKRPYRQRNISRNWDEGGSSQGVKSTYEPMLAEDDSSTAVPLSSEMDIF